MTASSQNRVTVQLHKACVMGNSMHAWCCLSSRFDMNKRDRDGKTPFYLACEYGRMEIVQMMLRLVGDVDDETDNEGQMPLFVASLFGHFYIVQLLLDLGADMKQENVDGITPLKVAFKFRKIRVVSLFLDRGGFNLIATNAEGFTILHGAVFEESIDLIRLLLDRGANVDAVDKGFGLTPLQLAVLKKAEDGITSIDNTFGTRDDVFDIAQLLLDRGADVNARRENDGKTPLHFACAAGENFLRRPCQYLGHQHS